PVRELDVAEVDVERRSRLDYTVDGLERGNERVDADEPPVARRVHVRKVEHGADPGELRRDEDDVLERAELAHAAHHLDSERDGTVLLLEPRAQLAELLDDGGERLLARTAEE